jgi:hypothetical protein
MTSSRAMRAALLGLTCAALALPACSRQERNDDCGPTERVVDPALLAFLSRARSAHHAADLQESAGDSAAALRALNGLVSGAVPAGNAPEVDEVLADTRARIADLLSRAERFDEADQEIGQGLTHAKSPSYFRGHLFEVRGLLEERREKALRGKGHGQEADKARDRSLSAYEEAMKIQAEVIGSAAPKPAGAAKPGP